MIRPKKPNKPYKPSKPTKPTRTYRGETHVDVWALIKDHSDENDMINIESLCEKLKTFTNARLHHWYDSDYIQYDTKITRSDKEYAKEMKKYDTQLRHYENRLKSYEEKMVKYQEKLAIYETKLNNYCEHKVKREVNKILRQSKKKGIDITEEEATKIVRLQVLNK